MATTSLANQKVLAWRWRDRVPALWLRVWWNFRIAILGSGLLSISWRLNRSSIYARLGAWQSDHPDAENRTLTNWHTTSCGRARRRWGPLWFQPNPRLARLWRSWAVAVERSAARSALRPCLQSDGARSREKPPESDGGAKPSAGRHSSSSATILQYSSKPSACSNSLSSSSASSAAFTKDCR